MEVQYTGLDCGLWSHAAAAKSHQSCLTLCDAIDSSPPGSHPWDSPGKYTGVGCHFLLQCMKVKSESEVAQLCPTVCHPMGCSLPDSSVHGISQARVLKWVAIVFSAGAMLLGIKSWLQSCLTSVSLHWYSGDNIIQHEERGHCSFLLGPGAHKVLFVPSKSLLPQSCGSSVIKSPWPPMSNSLGVLSPFATSPGWEICHGS